MRRLAAAIVWLTAVWVALWEDVTWANVLSGALIAFLITRRIRVVPSRVRHRVRPRAFLALVLYFVRELIKASLIVAWEVITRAPASTRRWCRYVSAPGRLSWPRPWPT